MKLEIKHLAPYLPYGLKLKRDSCHYIYTLKGMVFSDVVFETGKSPIKFIKPILRPISDISKEIEINGQKFTPIVELLKLRYNAWYEKKIGTRYAEIEFDNTSAWFSFQATFDIKVMFFKDDIFSYPDYWIIQKLAEWHIDFQGLIEKGLAININTL